MTIAVHLHHQPCLQCIEVTHRLLLLQHFDCLLIEMSPHPHLPIYLSAIANIIITLSSLSLSLFSLTCLVRRDFTLLFNWEAIGFCGCGQNKGRGIHVSLYACAEKMDPFDGLRGPIPSVVERYYTKYYAIGSYTNCKLFTFSITL